MSRLIFIWLGLIAVIVGVYVSLSLMNNNSSGASTDNSGNLTATLETTLGNIVVKFFPGDAPQTVANFIKLAQKSFYDGLTFHRVIPGFMIQGGDPFCGKNEEPDLGVCGTGGPGYKSADEINISSPLYRGGYKKGILAMANSGPNTNGSQFFIMVSNVPLPPNYTIFGQVVSGQDIADKISLVKRNASDRPMEAVLIKKIIINN